MADSPILVLEDNPTNMKLLRLVLADEGFAVSCATDAAEALALLEEQTPQLILTDIHLPGMDGLELTKLLRADRRFDSVWIVALTAYATPCDELKARQAGCDGFITKPIDAAALPALLRHYLASGRQRAPRD